MIYIQLNPRVQLTPGQPLLLQDAARVLGPEKVTHLALPCPDRLGVWKLQAIEAARVVQAACPGEDVTLIGPEVCYVHRVKPTSQDPTRPLRTAAAFLILCLGSALGLAWFHSDVDMPQAQAAVYEALTGEEARDTRLITVPYAIGVALGVAVFYALPDPRATTPLEVKLTTYQADMEKTEARDIE